MEEALPLSDSTLAKGQCEALRVELPPESHSFLGTVVRSPGPTDQGFRGEGAADVSTDIGSFRSHTRKEPASAGRCQCPGGGRNKGPPTGQLSTTEIHLSQFWRPQVGARGVPGPCSPRTLCEEGPSCLFQLPTGARSPCQWPSLLFSLPSALLRTLVTGFRAL